MNNNLTDEFFSKALFKDDDIGSVIRVHLYIEYIINDIIDIMVPFPDDLKSLQLDYDGKVNLICALGVDPKNKAIFAVLGKMRNKFSHNPFYKLTKGEVTNLYNAFSVEGKQILKKSHDSIRSEFKLAPYANLAPKDQFILIAVVIKNIALAVKAGINNK